uniref:Protein quiver n=1 Tax=Schistosoma mansoni TaxID=6183 RepID=A0A3Q0KPA1_SCHMA
MTSTVVCQVGIGPGLRCYQCNSLTQPHCADYFDNRTFPLVACPNDGRNYSRCVKMIQEMYLDGKWTRRYYRDCAVTGVIGAEDGRWCIDRLGTYRVKVRYCNCNNKNGCNSSTLLTVSTTTHYTFIFTVSIFYIYRILKV